ncbi:MAG: hypothetical protein QM478_11955 [Flavobacteriaceae bacterium]
MNLEQKNKENRKRASLTLGEWLTFFFIPVNMSSRFFPTDDFNDHEVDRFLKHGYQNKHKESLIARGLGIIFYIIVFLILIKFT